MPNKGSLWESYLARRSWMKDLLKRIEGDGLIGAEIGVWKGDFIVHLLSVEPRIGKIYAIDPFFKLKPGEKNSKEIWDRNFKLVSDKLRKACDDKVVMVRGRSEEVSDQVPNDLDFISIDGDHSFIQVTLDILLYEPKMRKGGLFSGHDYYGRASNAVRPAVNYFLSWNKRDFHSLQGKVNSWWWYV